MYTKVLTACVVLAVALGCGYYADAQDPVDDVAPLVPLKPDMAQEMVPYKYGHCCTYYYTQYFAYVPICNEWCRLHKPLRKSICIHPGQVCHWCRNFPWWCMHGHCRTRYWSVRVLVYCPRAGWRWVYTTQSWCVCEPQFWLKAYKVIDADNALQAQKGGEAPSLAVEGVVSDGELQRPREENVVYDKC